MKVSTLHRLVALALVPALATSSRKSQTLLERRHSTTSLDEFTAKGSELDDFTAKGSERQHRWLERTPAIPIFPFKSAGLGPAQRDQDVGSSRATECKTRESGKKPMEARKGKRGTIRAELRLSSSADGQRSRHELAPLQIPSPVRKNAQEEGREDKPDGSSSPDASKLPFLQRENSVEMDVGYVDSVRTRSDSSEKEYASPKEPRHESDGVPDLFAFAQRYVPSALTQTSDSPFLEHIIGSKPTSQASQKPALMEWTEEGDA